MRPFRWIVLSGDAALPAAVHAGQPAVADLWLICVLNGLMPAPPMGGRLDGPTARADSGLMRGGRYLRMLAANERRPDVPEGRGVITRMTRSTRRFSSQP